MILCPPPTSVAAKLIRFAAFALLFSRTAGFVARAAEHQAEPAHPEATAPAAEPLSQSSPAASTAAVGNSPAPAVVFHDKPPAAAQLTPLPPNAAVKPHTPPLTPSISAREAQGLINLGGSLTDRGDFDAAEIAFRQVLKGNAAEDATKTALLGMARMHRKKAELTKAAAIYERYLKDYPGDDRVPDALLELGRTLRDMGAPRLAIARFYNVINSTLKLPTGGGFEHYQLLAKTAQFEVAETHFQSGDYAEANKFFSRLRMLDLAPADRARAHFKAAYSLHLAGDAEGAVASLKAFIDQWPDDQNVPEARHLLATTLRSLKRSPEALASTLELLKSEKTRSVEDTKRWSYWQRRTGNQLANEFFQTGDIINALAIYHGLAALSDETSWRLPVAYQIALCYERLNDAERAGKMYQTILDTAGTSTAGDVVDIGRMASARLAHLQWRTETNQQFSTLFDSTTGKTPLTPATPSFNDPNRSPAPAPATL